MGTQGQGQGQRQRQGQRRRRRAYVPTHISVECEATGGGVVACACMWVGQTHNGCDRDGCRMPVVGAGCPWRVQGARGCRVPECRVAECRVVQAKKQQAGKQQAGGGGAGRGSDRCVSKQQAGASRVAAHLEQQAAQESLQWPGPGHSGAAGLRAGSVAGNVAEGCPHSAGWPPCLAGRG